jgi:branched-chain amino acid transport system permease protein
MKAHALAREDSGKRRHVVASMTPFSRYALIALGALLVLLAFGPLWLDRGPMQLILTFCIYLTLAQMWNLLAGYAGLVSVGQQAYVGLGAYSLLMFAVFRDAHPLYSVVMGGLISGLVAIPVAWLMFRLKGAYFAIGTWVLAEVFMLTFAQISAFGGGSGMSIPTPVIREIAASRDAREAIFYWSGLVLAVGSIGLVYAVLRSRFGLALAAIRDSETAAESLGVDTSRAKYIVYIAAAVVTGLAGGLYYLSISNFIAPAAAFSLPQWTAYVIFIVIIGGVGRIEGPIVGTIVFFILREFLSDSGTVYLIILGVLAIAVMLVAPRGIWGLVVERFGVEVFPVQRRLVVPDEASKGSAPQTLET